MPGSIDSKRHLDFVTRKLVKGWIEVESSHPEALSHPRKPPPIATLIMRKPWLLPRLLRRDIPE